MIQIKLKSFDTYYINLANNFVKSIFSSLHIDSIHQINLPSHIKKFTVLQSPHIDKKSREQFQLKIYKQIIQIKLLEKQKAFLLIELLKNLELIGIEMEIKIKFLDYFIEK
jgi:small subunit ribosomal protein S10